MIIFELVEIGHFYSKIFFAILLFKIEALICTCSLALLLFPTGYGHLLAACGLRVSGKHLRGSVRSTFLDLYAPDNDRTFSRDV